MYMQFLVSLRLLYVGSPVNMLYKCISFRVAFILLIDKR